ncbi:unnamed protein product [Sphenostylis stenocarpa]|uniref:Uncharacterized protein n=1 Tax=Sphenostylis stenocarpa TaxID=92480 RepID=A0AA86W179_9FABA|nr:unnamed protein product [Sphenostylis stenocarpa]
MAGPQPLIASRGPLVLEIAVLNLLAHLGLATIMATQQQHKPPGASAMNVTSSSQANQ